MHLKIVEIEGLRAFQKLKWELPTKSLKGWHVIIGDNGSGKSTFLRAISLALCGVDEIQALREDWKKWLRSDVNSGKVSIAIEQHNIWDMWAGSGAKLKNYYPSCGIRFSRKEDSVSIKSINFKNNKPERHLWSREKGWFSAAYGPFRRFTGGDPEQKKLFYSHPFLARHLTIFGENVALTESLEWLEKLRFEQLDGKEESGQLLDSIIGFVNQEGFLPHSVKFNRVTSEGVIFKNPEGIQMDVTRLSDGFRSVLSLTFELIRQLAACYQTTDIFHDEPLIEDTITIQSPGVVLIDEVDVHLHPTWQRKIGLCLTKYFPNIQFIVTTHSPLVCQSAEIGSVFRLPTPGKEDHSHGFVKGHELHRLTSGDVLDAYGTELFGQGVDRSDTAQEKMAELAKLNQKTHREVLSKQEKERRRELQSAFPTS